MRKYAPTIPWNAGRQLLNIWDRKSLPVINKNQSCATYMWDLN
jgi:hypothetical protein